MKDHATKPETPSSLPAPPQMPLPEIPQPWLVSARPTINFVRVHMYALIYSICFPLSDLVTDSEFIHVSANDPVSFVFMAE